MSTAKHLPLFFWLAVGLLCLLRAATAQDLDSVTISGKVTDQNSAVIPGATITATVMATRGERTVVADRDGNYKLIQLPPGIYKIKASFSGFATEEKTNLTTIAGRNVQLNFQLQPAGVSAEAVVVSADPAQVDTTRTIAGGTVTTREVDSLPNNSRSPIDLIFTLGGVSEEALSTRDLAQDRAATRSTPEEAGYFSISGAPAYSNNIRNCTY